MRLQDLPKVQTLLSQGANPLVRFESRWTALHLAAAKGFLDVCSLLCDCTSELLTTDSKNRTPLHLCTMEGHSPVLQLLLTCIHPSDLDQVDCEGNTPLHYAARRRDERAIELLLSHGASSIICNLDGQSPLTLCTEGPGYDLLRDSMDRRKQSNPFAVPRLAGSEPALTDIDLVLPADPPTPAPVSLDSFIPLGLLGKGQFGEVFLVQHRPTGKQYAMKSVSKGRDMTHYLKTERNVLAKLSHPFVVRLHWAFQTSSNLYLVVDYCPAGDLAELIRSEGRLTEDAAKFFAAEVVLCFIWCESHRHQVSCEISDKLTGIHMRWALWVRYGLLALCSTLCFFVLAGAEVESSPTTLYISMLGFDAAQCGVTIGLVLRAGNRLKYAVRQAFPQSPTRRIVCVQLALLSITFVNALLDIALIFAHYDGMATLQSDQQIW